MLVKGNLCFKIYTIELNDKILKTGYLLYKNMLLR